MGVSFDRASNRPVIYIAERKAKRCLAKLVEQAYAGQRFVIMRDGAPYVRLVAPER